MAEENADPEKNDDRGRKRILKVIAMLGASACVFVLLAVLAAIQNEQSQRRSVATGAQGLYSIPLPTPTPRPTPYWTTGSYKIEREAIALRPGQFWGQPLAVKDEWRNARLVGRFTAQGGGGNDVKAFITDDDGLVNFKNDHSFKVWYQSGRITVDTINVPLPTGKTYFVFDNTFSIFAHKSVTFDLRVEYEQLVQP